MHIVCTNYRITMHFFHFDTHIGSNVETQNVSLLALTLIHMKYTCCQLSPVTRSLQSKVTMHEYKKGVSRPMVDTCSPEMMMERLKWLPLQKNKSSHVARNKNKSITGIFIIFFMKLICKRKQNKIHFLKSLVKCPLPLQKKMKENEGQLTSFLF